MAYRTIIVGTDRSPTARKAERAAARLADRLGAELVVFTAEDVPPAEGLVREAQRRSADLIVVGRKGMGKVRRLRLGPIAEQVAQQAPCDLLIARTTAPTPTAGHRDYRRLLIGTDGSETATEAARKGFFLAELLMADVTLLYVGNDLDGRITLEETARDQPDTVGVEPIVVPGDPAERLCELAARRDIDLIVVGNRGVPGQWHLLTAVPLKVAHGAPSDVLVAKTMGRSLADIAPGHGAVVMSGGRRVAAFRDEHGVLHTFSPRCNHLGCTVGWNDADRTWDCPCHGSRYDRDGTVVHGPAKEPLTPIEL